MYILRRIWNPEMYQGKYKRNRYFEGWYYKLIDKRQNNVLVVIPGVSYSMAGKDAHAFIQLVDASNNKTWYFPYDISEFRFSEKSFEFSIRSNHFNSRSAIFDLNSDDMTVKGKLNFSNIIPFPRTFACPGIMGPYSFIPFMECYHGIVNISHEITGTIHFNNRTISFDGGNGYIEKDWGHSFPEAWIWLQSNHFAGSDVSVMFSIAKIPWLRRHFTGFISFLRTSGKFYRFATYTGAKIRKLDLLDKVLNIVITDNENSLHIYAEYGEDMMLKAPVNGMMDREIFESISANTEVSLYGQNGRLIFKGNGRSTGIEIAGDIHQLNISDKNKI